MKKLNDIIFINKPIPRDVRKQVEMWDWYAKISPVLYIVIGLILYHTGIDVSTILWGGLAVGALTAVTWWFWTIHTISKISEKITSAEEGIQSVSADLKVIKELIREIRNS